MREEEERIRQEKAKMRVLNVVFDNGMGLQTAHFKKKPILSPEAVAAAEEAAAAAAAAAAEKKRRAAAGAAAAAGGQGAGQAAKAGAGAAGGAAGAAAAAAAATAASAAAAAAAAGGAEHVQGGGGETRQQHADHQQQRPHDQHHDLQERSMQQLAEVLMQHANILEVEPLGPWGEHGPASQVHAVYLPASHVPLPLGGKRARLARSRAAAAALAEAAAEAAKGRGPVLGKLKSQAGAANPSEVSNARFFSPDMGTVGGLRCVLLRFPHPRCMQCMCVRVRMHVSPGKGAGTSGQNAHT